MIKYIGILFRCWKYLHDRIISLKGKVLAPKTSLTLSLFKPEQSCICVLEVSILSLSMILIFDIGIIPIAGYFFTQKWVQYPLRLFKSEYNISSGYLKVSINIV